jgi:hypothetical protein
LCDELVAEKIIGRWSDATIVLRPGMPSIALRAREAEVVNYLSGQRQCRVVILLQSEAELPEGRRMIAEMAEKTAAIGVLSELSVFDASVLAVIARPERS